MNFSWQSLLMLVVIGLGAGTLAKVLLPGKDGTGLISTALVGIAGSFVGSYGSGLLKIDAGGSLPILIAAQVVGAIALLVVFRIIRLIV